MQVLRLMEQLCKDFKTQLQHLWRDPTHIKLGEKIGNGFSGIVRLAEDGKHQRLAVKLISGVYVAGSGLDALLKSREVSTLRRELVVISQVAGGVRGVCRCANLFRRSASVLLQLLHLVVQKRNAKKCTAIRLSSPRQHDDGVAFDIIIGMQVPRCDRAERAARHPDDILQQGLLGSQH
jgi:hypothetical protein